MPVKFANNPVKLNADIVNDDTIVIKIEFKDKIKMHRDDIEEMRGMLMTEAYYTAMDYVE